MKSGSSKRKKHYRMFKEAIIDIVNQTIVIDNSLEELFSILENKDLSKSEVQKINKIKKEIYN